MGEGLLKGGRSAELLEPGSESSKMGAAFTEKESATTVLYHACFLLFWWELYRETQQ